MNRPRLRPRLPRSLRGRIGAVLAVVLTLGLAVAALVMALVVRHVLVDRLDQQLRAAGDRYAVSLERGDNDADNRGGVRGVDGQATGTLGARLKDGRVTDAAVVGSVETAGGLSDEARATLSGLALDPDPHSLHLHDLGDYRVIVTAGQDGDLLITGLPEEGIDETTDKLVAVVVGVFAATLVVVVLAATGLLRLVLRPLTRVSATATEVAGLSLDQGEVVLPHRVDTGSGGRELDALGTAFNAMLEQVEGALVTRARSEDRLRRFIADASHELRTPVAVVRSHAELARREGGAALPEAVGNSLARIVAQSERMGHLVEDLLLLARLDAGRPLGREPVDLVRAVLVAVEDARTAHADHRWQLRLPEHGVEVVGDAHALEQVITNLIGNAATHTPSGSTVTVTLTESRTDHVATVRLAVADDGPGMPPEVAARPLDRFVRGAGDRADTRGSSGLGLSIVAAIVTAHGGDVDIETGSTGTTVAVTLPASAPARDGAAD